jgi:chromosome segregation ATPase
MSTRRLEMSVEHMKAKTTTQPAELGKKANAVNQLRKELSEKTATIFELEARDKTIKDQLRATEEEFNLKNGALHEAERMLSDKQAELAKLIAELGEHSIMADSQRVELAAMRTQVEAMKVSVADYERVVKETELRLTRERTEVDTTTTHLNDARGKVDSLGARTTELERQLLAQTTEAEFLNRRVHELEVRLGEQGRLLAARDYQIEQQRSDIEAAQNLEADLRSELASHGTRNSAVIQKLRSDVTEREAQLAVAMEERAKLQHDVATMKREAESTWAAERVENAMLRERINDVAAEVARLTAALEGPDSPIESMLAIESPALGQGAGQGAGKGGGQGAGNGTPAINGLRGQVSGREPHPDNKSTLADRIRALQSTASRVASSN